MTPRTLSFTFDRDAVWKKVRDRKPVVLDMNCWINMGDDKSTLATKMKGTLRRLVSEGHIFCPLSFGLIVELYKQAVDSMLRVGTLMEELSLSVSYASREEIFAWEVERAIRKPQPGARPAPILCEPHQLGPGRVAFRVAQHRQQVRVLFNGEKEAPYAAGKWP